MRLGLGQGAEHKVDLGAFQVGAHHFHRQRIAQLEGHAALFADNRLALHVEVEVILAQLRDMQQAFDVHVVQQHKHAKAGDGADLAGEHFAHLVAHEVALQPGVHIAGGVVGAAFGHRTVFAQRRPGLRRGVLAALQDGLDGAVHQQIRIPANRRGEVGVSLIRQAKVADVVRAVHRLLQAAQQHGLQHGGVRARLDLVHQLGVVLGGRRIAAGQGQAGQLQKAVQDFQFFRGGAFVHAVQARMGVLEQEIRRADVGGQHAFFDQPMRVVAGDRHNALDFALFVEQHLRFGGFKVDGAATVAGGQQHLEQRIQVLHMRQHRVFAAVLQPVPHLVVGQPRLGQHHRRVEGVAANLATAVDVHVAHHAQAFDFRVQRANAVGQRLGQHRDHPAREIHRIAALDRGEVQRVAGLHIMADVGNRHHQTETLALRFAIHRVVKVARGFAVDGHQRQVAQVAAVGGEVFFADFLRGVAGLFQRAFREFMRQVVLAQGDFDFHAGVGVIAQHLNHSTHRLLVAAGLFHQLDHHHLAMLAVGVAVGLDQNILVQAAVFRHGKPDAALAIQSRHHRLIDPLDHFDDGGFWPTAPIQA